LLYAVHPRRTLPSLFQPKVQLQRSPPFPALTPRRRLPPSTIILHFQRLHVDRETPLYRPRMFPRLVLIRQAHRLLAKPEETLHKTDFLPNVTLSSLKQHAVAVRKLCCPAVLFPPNADLEVRDIEDVRGFVGRYRLGCWGRGWRVRRLAPQAWRDSVEEERAVE
jgi:hypothetical protein